MKFTKLIAAVLLLAAFLVGCGSETQTSEAPDNTEEPSGITTIKNGMDVPGYYYTNSLTDNAADPFILYHDGTYYLYATGGSRFSVRSTQYLNAWPSESKVVLQLSDTSWAKEKGWAPEVYEHGGKFYMIYSAEGYNGLHAIDIAVSDAPDGEFVPLSGDPFFAPEYNVIDGTLFFDDDGRIYMYYSKDGSTNDQNGKRVSQIYGIEVAQDFSSVIGEPVLISTPEQDWELKSGSVLWNEGPVVFKENGVYYLLFSANYYMNADYSVGYATSNTPLADFVKPDKARILSSAGDTVTGPGHCNLLRSPDGSELYMVYHVHTVSPNAKNGRSLAIDRLVVCEDGTLAVDGPSYTRRALPSGANGYSHVHADEITCTGTGEKAEFASKSAIENLFDGIAKTSFDGLYSMDEGGSVEIKLNTPSKLTAIMIYPSAAAEYVPSKVDVEINGTYVIKGLKFSSRTGVPVTATLSNLPAETKVETIKLTVHLAEGNSYAALNEVVMVTAKSK